MPRLSNELYLTRRRFLRHVSNDFDDLFAILPFEQQADLHHYYQTHVEADDATLLGGRRTVTKDQPSLPQTTGRSFHRVYEAFRHAYAYAQGDEYRFRQAIATLSNPATPPSLTIDDHHHAQRRIYVHGIAQPEVDTRKLARAFIGLAII